MDSDCLALQKRQVQRESLELPGERHSRQLPSPRRSSVAACYPSGQPLYTLRRNTSLSTLPIYPEEGKKSTVSHQRSEPEIAVRPLPPSPHPARGAPRGAAPVPRPPLQRAAAAGAPGSTVTLLKFLLIAFSFVSWAAGLSLLSAGLWTHLALSGYLLLSTNRYPNAPAILLSTGAALLLWGALGCWAAAAERRRLLRAFALFQGAVLVAGIAAGLSALFYRRDIAEGFRGGLRKALQSYPDHEERAEALDTLQRTLRCCGVDSFGDWLGTPWDREQQQQLGGSAVAGSNGSVPASCCRRRRGCRHSPLPPQEEEEETAQAGIHRDGCFRKVHDFVSDNMFYIATAALGLALTQVVGIVLACLLAARIPGARQPPRDVTV